MKSYFLLCLVSLFFLGGLFFYQNSRLNDGKLHFVVCDVGQGDAILIRTPNGSDILIDGGPDDSVLGCLNKHMPFWDRTIEVMVLTHPHEDHLAGLISVLKRYNVLHFLTEKVISSSSTFKSLEAILKTKNLKVEYLFSKDSLVFADKTSFLTLWPENQWFSQQKSSTFVNASLDLNGFSLVNMVSYGNFKALLTGDAGSVVEDRMAIEVGKIDLLKVPHHGSKTGMSDYFLSQIKPSIAVISVGAKNKYGHPAQSALDLLAKYSIKTLRTDKNKEVEIVTDGKDINVTTN